MYATITASFSILVLFVLGQAIRHRIRTGELPLASVSDPLPSRAAHLVETLIGLGLTVWTLGLAAWVADPGWWLGHPHIAAHRTGLELAAAALMPVSVAIVVLGNLRMGESWYMGIRATPQKLVDQGLYGHVRHPIYLGMLGFVSCGALLMPTWWMIPAGAVTMASLLVEAALEEDYWLRAEPEAYAEVLRRTSGFFPWKSVLRWVARRP